MQNETADKAFEEYGFVYQKMSREKRYTNLPDMLAEPEIEVVYIATPNSIHFSQAKAALLPGKHVICENPFTPTVAETKELVLP